MKRKKARDVTVACLSFTRGIALKYTDIIWDFNGTILDDVDIGVCSINVLLSARGLPTLSPDRYREVSGFPIVDYYKRIGFDFSEEPYDKVALEWVEQYRSREKQAPLCAGALEMLAYMRQKGLRLTLLSATEIRMLNGQISDLGLASHFDEVWGMDNVYAHGKASIGRSWREKHPDARALLIGDTDHDYEVALAIGADCVLFSGGHQSVRRLSSLGVPVIGDLVELKDYLL